MKGTFAGLLKAPMPEEPCRCARRKTSKLSTELIQAPETDTSAHREALHVYLLPTWLALKVLPRVDDGTVHRRYIVIKLVVETFSSCKSTIEVLKH